MIECINDYTFWSDLLQQFTDFGGVGGIALTFIEAVFPILPLSVFVTINIVAFGFLKGFLYSVVGSSIGTITMYTVIKHFGQSYFLRMRKKSRKVERLFKWIHSRGFVPIFLLFSFPFTPSLLICGLAVLAEIEKKHFIYATIFGKTVMILSLSVIGYNISSFTKQPVKSVIFIGVILSISFIAKQIVKRYEAKVHQEKNI